jgi:hypothetical protein
VKSRQQSSRPACSTRRWERLPPKESPRAPKRRGAKFLRSNYEQHQYRRPARLFSMGSSYQSHRLDMTGRKLDTLLATEQPQQDGDPLLRRLAGEKSHMIAERTGGDAYRCAMARLAVGQHDVAATLAGRRPGSICLRLDTCERRTKRPRSRRTRIRGIAAWPWRALMTNHARFTRLRVIDLEPREAQEMQRQA